MMSADFISEHFRRFLGADVGVSFADETEPRRVILYRPDRLPDAFVTDAYVALTKAAPVLAETIERVTVSFETRLGRSARRVDLPDAAMRPNRNLAL
jgi:hypothetical protein